jgi:membrane protein
MNIGAPIAHWHARLWDNPALRDAHPLKAHMILSLRGLQAIARDLTEGRLILYATSLVYTTLLSLVPLLAVSFSVLKAFGVHNQLEPVLRNVLAPLGNQSSEIAATIIGFVGNMKVGVLGTVGLTMLFYTVVSVMQKIEAAFNDCWRIAAKRTFQQRFSDYLSVVIVGPVIVFSALGITATVMDNRFVQALAVMEPTGMVPGLVSRLVPYLMIIGAFTFIYVFMPNTRVRVRSAFTGALIAGVLWQTIGWGFAHFVAGSSQYTAIYSAFAGLLLFMVWVYLAWLILLIGADIAFYHQHPEYLLAREREPRVSLRMRERLALACMAAIARRQYRGDPPPTVDALAAELLVPRMVIAATLAELEAGGVVSRGAGPITTWLPSRPLETLSITKVLWIVRHSGETQGLTMQDLPLATAADAGLTAAQAAANTVLDRISVKDLADRSPVDG